MSRLKSGPAAKGGRGAKSGGGSRSMPAQRGGSAASRGIYVQQPKNDIFTILLGVALGALLIGCLFLVLKLNQYGFAINGPA